MNTQLLALRKRIVEQAVVNPDLLGDELTFESNAAEAIDFNGVLQRTSRKTNTGDEAAADQYDATLLMLLTDYQSLKAAVPDFRNDGWIIYDGQRFYLIGEADNDGATITVLLSVTQHTTLGRAYPRKAGRASHG